MEKFAIGLVIGGLGGALLVANNYKMRTLIKKGQAEVQAKLNQLMDEKMEEIDDAVEGMKAKAKETADEVKDALSEKVDNVKEKSRRTLKKAGSANN